MHNSAGGTLSYRNKQYCKSRKRTAYRCLHRVRGTESIFAGHRIVMVGETDGTNEMPAMFTRLVCAALQRGHVVSVGLELPSNQRELLDDYMASDIGHTTASPPAAKVHQ